MQIIIVNEKNEAIGTKQRGTLNYKKDIYRVSALWITNSKNQILLAKRAHTKKQNPDKWGPAVAGTIEEGETYDSNIVKEAEEELGLKNIKPKKWIKTNTKGKKYQHFTQWYKLELDKPLSYFKPNEEVAEIRWFSKDETVKLIEENSDQVLKSIKEVIEQGVTFS